MSPEMRVGRDGRLRPRRKGAVQPLAIAWMALVWCLFWRDFSVANALSGAVLGIGVQLAFPLPPLRMDGRLRIVGLLRLVWMFLSQMLVASVEVSTHVLRREHPKPAVVEVDLTSESDFVMTLVSLITTLIPGSVVVEARRSTHTLFIHVLDVGDDRGVEEFRQRTLGVEQYVLGIMTQPPKPEEVVR